MTAKMTGPMANVTVLGLHLPTVVKIVTMVGSPTEGPLAEKIWHISNMQSLPAEIAEEFLVECGYVPFKGYPLTRSNS